MCVCVCVCVTIYPHGRSPLSQLLKPVHGHPIVQWPLPSPAGGISHALQTHNKHSIYNREWKKEEQTPTWVSPKRKKGEVFGTFLAFCASVSVTSVYSKIPTQLPGTLTHPLVLVDPASGSTGPNFSLSNTLSLTFAFPWLSLTAFFCWLPWDLAFSRLLPVS